MKKVTGAKTTNAKVPKAVEIVLKGYSLHTHVIRFKADDPSVPCDNIYVNREWLAERGVTGVNAKVKITLEVVQ